MKTEVKLIVLLLSKREEQLNRVTGAAATYG